MLDQRELEEMVKEHLGERIELTYDGYRPIGAYGASENPYHVFFYDLEGQRGTYVGGAKAIAIPGNGRAPYILFTKGE